VNVGLAQRIGFAAWAALALLQILWHAWLLPPHTAPLGLTLTIALVPLALPLAYWRVPRRALLVAGMIGLFYFCHGVAEAWSAPDQRTLACIEIALPLVLVLAQARRPQSRHHGRTRAGGPRPGQDRRAMAQADTVPRRADRSVASDSPSSSHDMP
jgi:uncharacterized membrane protein